MFVREAELSFSFLASLLCMSGSVFVRDDVRPEGSITAAAATVDDHCGRTAWLAHAMPPRAFVVAAAYLLVFACRPLFPGLFLYFDFSRFGTGRLTKKSSLAGLVRAR